LGVAAGEAFVTDRMILPPPCDWVEARLPGLGRTACGGHFALAAGRRCGFSRWISRFPRIPSAKTSIRALDPS